MSYILDREIKYLPGIGEKRAALLEKELGIRTFRDMLYTFPYRYIDRSKIYSISEIDSSMAYIQLRGRIVRTSTAGAGKASRFIATLKDDSGTIDLVFFKGVKWIQEKISPAREYIVFGKPSMFNGCWNMVHPELDPVGESGASSWPSTLIGIYSSTDRLRNNGISIKVFARLQHTLQHKISGLVQETLPQEVIASQKLPSLAFALANIHFPKDMRSLEAARYRLKFEELFFLQLSLLRQRNVRMSGASGILFQKVGAAFNYCYSRLPYELTGAQKRVIKEIRRDTVSGRQMNRLLQGDVGSGKTTVLITKVMYLHYEKQIPYEQMVVLTFTNKAADEIKERLHALEPEITEEQLWGFGTFHSVCLTMLKKMLPVENLGYTKEFMVMDPDEEFEMAEQLILTYQLKIKYKNRLKKRLEQKNSKYQDDIEKLKALLKEEKRRQDKMTFDELLDNTCKLVKMSAEIEEVSKKNANLQDNENTGMQDISWIIVDEVQDSDEKQLELIDCLKKTQTCFFAVGDPNQVIYSWRGSAFHIFYQLKTKYQATELTLPVNYRSSSEILAVARCFMQQGDTLQGGRENGDKIQIRNMYDPFQEADYLAGRIRDLHASGLPYREMAIFYRLQNQSEIFEHVFEKEGIPFEVSLKRL